MNHCLFTVVLSAVLAVLAVLSLSSASSVHAFLPPSSSIIPHRSCRPSTPSSPSTPLSPPSPLYMALDPVTYLRTEWVSAALCTNQTPRSADRVLQLGSEDGRIVNFVPRTVREIVTSSAEADGGKNGKKTGLSVGCERQLNQMASRRSSAKVTLSSQPADDLTDTPSESMDVVVSLQAAQRMADNGYDWKKSVIEAGRVLKPGGRFLFVETRTVTGGNDGSDSNGGGGEDYLEYILSLSEDSYLEDMNGDAESNVEGAETDGGQESDSSGSTADPTFDSTIAKITPIFQEVGYDDVDLVLQPHVAGVAIKAFDANLTLEERKSKQMEVQRMEEEEKLADRAIGAFERGNKRRKRKKKKGMGKDDGEDGE